MGSGSLQRRAEKYYEHAFLGYSPGMKASTAGYLSNYVQQRDTTELPAKKNSQDAGRIVLAMQQRTMKSQYMRRLLGTGDPEAEVPRPQKLVKTSSGKWVKQEGVQMSPQPSPGLPDVGKFVTIAIESEVIVPARTQKRIGHTTGGCRVRDASGTWRASPRLPSLRHPPPLPQNPSCRPQDVFLSTARLPLIGAPLKDRVSAGPKSRGDNAASVQQQLQDFELRHKELLSRNHTVDRDIKVAAMLAKSKRVRQVRDLKGSVLPKLLRNMPPNKLQELYASVTGGLAEEMMAPSFAAFVTHLLRPDPPLPAHDTTWMFEAIDKDGSGSVSFVELVEVLSAVVTPPAVQDTAKRLYTLLQPEPGKPLTRAVLEPTHILAAVRQHYADLSDKQACDPAEVTKKLYVWKSVAEQIFHASLDLRFSDQLGRDEFTVLLFMNTQIMEQLQVAAL